MNKIILIQGKKETVGYDGPIPEIGSVIDLEDGRGLKVLSVHYQSVMIMSAIKGIRIDVQSIAIRTRWI